MNNDLIMLPLRMLGIINQEEYYNLQAVKWGYCRFARWLLCGKPQSWLIRGGDGQ